MAIEHFHIKPVCRSQGDSAVAGAAYRHAAKLLSIRTGRTINMTQKRGVLHSEFLAPPETPQWLVADAQTFWNEVERCEVRADARLAREVEFALPRELTFEQNLALAREIIQEQFVNRGMVAHFAIHDEMEDGISKPHVHCMLTTRRVGPNGFAKTKERAWDAVELVLEARAGWSASTNRALAMAGHEARIDHRSYRARGINLEPQPKIGRKPRDAGSDGRDHVRARGKARDAVRERNADRLLVEPAIAFNFLTTQRSTFTLGELKRFVADRTLNEEQYEDAMLLAMASPELVKLPPDEQGRERFTHRAVVEREETLIRCGARLAESGSHRVTEELVEQAIALSPHKLNEGQAQAIRYLAEPRALSILEGYAGTGKSTVASAARLAWESQGYRVLGGALTHTAVDALSSGSTIPSRTIRSWLKSWDRGVDTLTARDVFVIDEAGMVGTADCAELIQYVRSARAKLVLIGDTRQLPAIDPGAPMRLLAKHFGSERLSQIVRQRNEWQRELAIQFANYETSEALTTYHARGHVVGYPNTHAAVEAMVDRWDTERKSAPAETSLLLAFRRADVRLLNEAARQRRRAAGMLGRDIVLETPNGPRAFAVGDRILFYETRRGEPNVKNGTLGTLEWRQGDEWVVRLDDQRQVVVDTRDYQSLDHGYAGTLHKSQCATVDRAYVLASPHLDAASVYVGLSRHREDVRLFYSEEEFGSAKKLIERISRVNFEPMAHELDLERAERLVRSFEDEAKFVNLPRKARGEVLASVARASDKPELTQKEAFSKLAQVEAAEREKREAVLSLEQAKRELGEYRIAHPVLAKVAARTRELEAQIASASQLLAHAEGVLRTLHSDSRLQAEATARMESHNERLHQLHRSWRSLMRLDRRHASVGQLDQLARAENARQRRVLLRTATTHDEGKQFEVEREERIGGSSLLFLRDGKGGPLIIAHAGHCRRAEQNARVQFQWLSPFRSNANASFQPEPSRVRSRQ